MLQDTHMECYAAWSQAAHSMHPAQACVAAAQRRARLLHRCRQLSCLIEAWDVYAQLIDLHVSYQLRLRAGLFLQGVGALYWNALAG